MKFAENDPYKDGCLFEQERLQCPKTVELASLLDTPRRIHWLYLMIAELALVVDNAMCLPSNQEKMENASPWCSLLDSWSHDRKTLALLLYEVLLSEDRGQKQKLELAAGALAVGARFNTLHLKRLKVEPLTVIGDSRLLEFVLT